MFHVYVFASSRINFCVWRGASFILLFHICSYGSNCRCSPIFYLSCFWAHGRSSVPWSPWSWLCPCDLLWSKDNKQKNVYTHLMYWNWIWKMKRELAFSHGSWSITAERVKLFWVCPPAPSIVLSILCLCVSGSSLEWGPYSLPQTGDILSSGFISSPTTQHQSKQNKSISRCLL